MHTQNERPYPSRARQEAVAGYGAIAARPLPYGRGSEGEYFSGFYLEFL